MIHAILVGLLLVVFTAGGWFAGCLIANGVIWLIERRNARKARAIASREWTADEVLRRES